MTLEKSDDLHVPEFRPVPSSCHWKVGIDLGRATTVYHELYLSPGKLARPSSSVLPTLIGFAGRALSADPHYKDLIEIGESAARRRDHMEVLSPLDAQPPRRPAVLLEYAAALRREMSRNRSGRPWGVMAVPSDAEPGQVRELRTIAGELFEHLLLVEEPILVAVGVLQDHRARNATVIDIGSRSIRASLVGGCSPRPEHRFTVPQGGETVDADLKRLLLQKYPDLVLTDLTINRVKEQLGFVAPARKTARIQVVLGQSRRLIDITDMLREACEAGVAPVLRAIREVIARCPSDHIDSFMKRIFLVGGGAAMPGLPERIQAELDREGYDQAVVHAVAHPRTLLALGALKWALMTPDGSWEVPLFAFRPAG